MSQVAINTPSHKLKSLNASLQAFCKKKDRPEGAYSTVPALRANFARLLLSRVLVFTFVLRHTRFACLSCVRSGSYSEVPKHACKQVCKRGFSRFVACCFLPVKYVTLYVELLNSYLGRSRAHPPPACHPYASPPQKRFFVGCSSPFERCAKTPHGAALLVQAMSTWSV